MSEQTNTAKAEALVALLEGKRAKLIQDATDLQDERAHVALAAHTGDKAARKRLDEINAALAVHQSEPASLDAALRAAGEKLAAARTAEAIAQDRTVALQVKQVIAELQEHGAVLDDALADLVTAGANLKACFDRLALLGVTSPRYEQLAVLGNLAILTALGQTIWKRGFETLAPNQRKNFAAVMAEWCSNLTRDVERRLGEQQQVTASDEVAA
jgi:hypothetical protein